jgi:hypothetical protein
MLHSFTTDPGDFHGRFHSTVPRAWVGLLGALYLDAAGDARTGCTNEQW